MHILYFLQFATHLCMKCTSHSSWGRGLCWHSASYNNNMSIMVVYIPVTCLAEHVCRADRLASYLASQVATLLCLYVWSRVKKYTFWTCSLLVWPTRPTFSRRISILDKWGPLLHVPITKYKIILNPNPNPNTNMTVNTIPKQM